MTPRTGADEDARQPLLSDTEYGHHDTDPEQPRNASSPELAKKDVQLSWQLFGKLLFGTRLRFFIFLGVLLFSSTLIGIAATDDRMPWISGRWPWSKWPEYHFDREIWEASRKLYDQPFCFPEVCPLQPVDIGAETGEDSFARMVTQTRSDMDWLNETTSSSDTSRSVSRCSSLPHSMIQHIETEFDKLSGSRVCESAKRYRQSVEFVASISRGKPFYSRSAKAFDFPVIVSSVNVAPKDGRFFSRSLWRVLEMLSLSSIQRYGRQVTIKDLLRALRLYESREIVLPGDRNSTINVIETTLSDTQIFFQTLTAILLGLLEPSKSLPLGPLVVHDLFSPHTLTTDGATASTSSPFSLLMKDGARSSRRSLSGIGSNWQSFGRLQHRYRPLHLYVLTETFADHELTVLLDIKRGVIFSALARLSEGPDHPSDDFARQQDHSGNICTSSVWDWMRDSVDDFFSVLAWGQGKRLTLATSGTYRYDGRNTDATQLSASASRYEWLEVDLEVIEGSLWVTRIDYALADKKGKSDRHVSVLSKYNVGGTANFFAGWSCLSWEQDMADCYRPRMGNDDSKCVCRNYGGQTPVNSSYRVGLWPKLDFGEPNVFMIPPGTIRPDGNSYMDQGIGGCSSLFGRMEDRNTVPEMDALGYMVRLNGAQAGSDGTVYKEAELEWLEPGLRLFRVSQPASERFSFRVDS